MNKLIVSLALMGLVGCGKVQTVSKCGVDIAVAPDKTIAVGYKQLEAYFSYQYSESSKTSTFTSLSDASCSFQVIQNKVQ